MWKTVDGKNGGNETRYTGGYSRNYGNMILHREFNDNIIDIDADSIHTGVYMFRIRNTTTGEVSKYFDTKLSIRTLKVFDTDITVSNKTYKGTLITSKLI